MRVSVKVEGLGYIKELIARYNDLVDQLTLVVDELERASLSLVAKENQPPSDGD